MNLTFDPLKIPHEKLSKMEWYNSWHQKSYAKRVHFEFLILNLLLLSSIIFFFLPQNPKKIEAQTPSITLDYPRLSIWWPGNEPASALAKYDYIGLQNWEDSTSKIPQIRAINPNIKLLADGNAVELSYAVNVPGYDAEHLGAVPTSWILLQVGSTLTTNVNSSQTVFTVADGSKFMAADLLIIDNELVLCSSVSGNSITVQRGWVGKVATSHSSGAKIAAAVSGWPGSVKLDITDNCPLGVATGLTPSPAPEKFRDWMARNATYLYNAADWDGIVMDVMGGKVSWNVGSFPSSTRSIADRSGNEVNYAAFDALYLDGYAKFYQTLRTTIGPDAIILGNCVAPTGYGYINGSYYEGVPSSQYSSLDSWRSTIIRPMWLDILNISSPYVKWAQQSSPNLTTISTYEYDTWMNPNPYGTPGWHPNYQKMRFGLTTALLGNGYFSYEMASNGHANAGLMWFDEYDNAGAGKGYLGQSTSEAYNPYPSVTTPDLLSGDGAFSTSGQLANWSLDVNSGYAATKTLDNGTVRLDVTSAAGQDNQISFRHNVALTNGTAYTLSFRIRADRKRTVGLSLHKNSTPWNSWVDFGGPVLDTEWRTFELSGISSGTDPVALVRFMLGGQVGTVWLDDIKLQEGTRPEVYRRDFQNGISLVNPTDTVVTVPLGGTYQKINGTQDRSVNDGSLVTSATLQPKDGIILLNVPSPTPSVTQVPVYRFWNRNGTHFYTASESEKNNVIARWPNVFTYEGVAYYLNTLSSNNNTPLYRFWNKQNGTHFYTASESEKNDVITRWGYIYQYEGPAYNVSLNPSNTTPVYRFWNVNGTHFYTASEAEKNNVVARWPNVFQYEGVGYYLAQ